MPAAVYVGHGEIEVQSLPVPEVGPGDVLVEVSHCGVCGTDLHLVLERYARPGSVLGHEWSGTVAAVGEAADGWTVGDRVVANPTPGCGECRACRRGRPAVCLRRPPPDHLAFSGAFCRYVNMPSGRLLRVPDGLETRAAALAEPTAIAIHTANLSGADPEDRVLITGGGPVGLLMTAVLRARGVTDITVAEPAAGRRDRALAIGARAVLAPDALPSAQWDARSTRRSRWPSSVPGTRAPPRPRSTSSTTPARSSSSVPVTTCLGSTTTGRSCSS
jgi:(R,R)-butanediol dehydrogenase/meso-butanediol dehydrogenase/diacetyl reductase